MRILPAALAAACLISVPAFAQGFGHFRDAPTAAEEEPVAEAPAEPEAKEEAPAPKSAAKPAPKPAPKPEPKPAPKPAAKPEPKPADKPAVKAEEPAPLPLSKPDADYVMLRVGTQDVPASEVKHMWEGLFPAGAAPDFDTLKPEMRDRVLRGVVAERLLWQEGLKQGMDKTDAVVRNLNEVKRKMVVKALLEAKTADLTDKDLMAEYNTEVAAMSNEKEVRARHILVGSEKEAKDVLKSLKSGKNFEEVARDYSKDPGSAKQGGDLGYFTKDKMVKEFSDAAFALKKGETSDPVKSSFGWHIIRVDDIRPVTIPTFNDAKDGIRERLQDKRLSDYVRSLVKAADVKLFDTKGKEISFNKDQDPVDTK